eukprot:242771-Pyramimonas_sp.AAC.1
MHAPAEGAADLRDRRLQEQLLGALMVPPSAPASGAGMGPWLRYLPADAAAAQAAKPLMDFG